MSDAAERIGMRTLSCKLTVEQLTNDICLPCILHWNQNHFVVYAFGEEPITPDLTHIRIKENPNETLEYIGKIGNDYYSALDSLRKLKDLSSEVIREPLEVIFTADDRCFWGINYDDCGMYSDVLDTKGNYYLRTWCNSDDNVVNVIVPALLNVHRKSFNSHVLNLSGYSHATPIKKGIYIIRGKKILKK